MAYIKGKFGIEYSAARVNPERHYLGLVVFLSLTALAISLIVKTVRRFTSPPEAVEIPLTLAREDLESAGGDAASGVKTGMTTSPAPSPARVVAEVSNRRADVRSLLLRLNAAETRKDVEMAISTIERIRALPGSPAADLDDRLARRLGELNLVKFLTLKSGQWIKEVVVKRGDNASRLASFHGTTLALVERLNGDVSSLRVGQRLYIPDHPHFSLAVYRVTRVVELSLDGKLFKRYYLRDEVKGKVGAYEEPVRLRRFFAENGIALAAAEIAEIELFVGLSAPITIAEFR